jgi:transposase-like protein
VVGPLPAGRAWTHDEEVRLLELVSSGIKVAEIARKLGRSAGALYARISKLKKAHLRRSRPSERLALSRADGLRRNSESAD